MARFLVQVEIGVWAAFPYGGSGEKSVSKLIEVVGRIQSLWLQN